MTQGTGDTRSLPTVTDADVLGRLDAVIEAARRSRPVGDCAFCPSSDPRYYVVGGTGVAIVICTPCFLEAFEFGVAEHDWQSWRSMTREEREACRAS